MNKKVLTLCAGFLLAGGLFSTANAAKLRTVMDNGKYYQLKMTNEALNTTTWSATPTTWDAQYLSIDASGASFLHTADATEGFWTIKNAQRPGETLPAGLTAKIQLINYATQEPLTITVGTEEINIFYTEEGSHGNTGLVCFNAANQKLQVGAYASPATNADDLSAMNFTAQSNFYFAALDAEEIDEEPISAADLNAELQNGFQIQIGETVKGKFSEFTKWATDENGNGNVFAGTLYAEAIGATGNYYLRKGKNGDYIVLTKELWGGTNSDLNGTDNDKGYRFDLYNAHDFAQLTNKDNAAFQILKTYDFGPAYGDSLIVTMPSVDVMGSTKEVRVFVADVNNQSYLTIVDYDAANDRLTQTDAKESPYIRLGKSNIVDFKDFAGKVWNITSGNKILSPDAKDGGELDKFISEFDPSSEVMLNAPEGEWLPYYTDADDYGFVNRESGVTWNLGQTDDAGNYWVVRQAAADSYTVWSSKYATGTPKYTINITEAASKVGKLADGSYHSITDAGYAKSEDAVKAMDGKYLTIENGVTGATMYVGKNADDEVILTEDQTKAIEFRVKDLEHDYTSHSGLAGVDTLQHYTTYYGYDINGKLANVQDTVRFQHFRLFEHFSEKYLIYDVTDQKFILSKLSATENAHEDFNMVINADGWVNNVFSTFVLKKKADGNYNIVSYYDVNYPICENNHTSVTGDFDNYFETNLFNGWRNKIGGNSLKMEGNVGKATVDNSANIYTHTNEDRIALVDIETPEYMKVTGAIDTAKISLQRQPNFFLYEHNANGTNFLSMEHVADVEDMKAAILVDTAYVRNNTYKPQYLLAVGAKHVEPVYDNAGHMLEPDTTYGRFLVNMVDSAIVYGLNKKSNPYIHEQLNGNNYYRLAFIDGIHTGDKLILNTAKAKTTIDLSNNNDKVCTFAFRYVDEDREGVKIETLYGVEANGTPIRGWLKYQNNVPVVTRGYDDAHVFLVDNTTTEAPTANEEISANAVVSVVATDGAVIVKGAEGKNVIVSTILGKVVANEVLNSDNETIAAPAGIVVVSVDGESFKVAVK